MIGYTQPYIYVYYQLADLKELSLAKVCSCEYVINYITLPLCVAVYFVWYQVTSNQQYLLVVNKSCHVLLFKLYPHTVTSAQTAVNTKVLMLACTLCGNQMTSSNCTAG